MKQHINIDGGKNMSFVTDDEKIYDKYNKIWELIKKLLKVNFTVGPIRDDKYLTAKLKIFNKVNKTKFTGDDVSDLDDAIDSHLNFLVTDSYVKI